MSPDAAACASLGTPLSAAGGLAAVPGEVFSVALWTVVDSPPPPPQPASRRPTIDTAPNDLSQFAFTLFSSRSSQLEKLVLPGDEAQVKAVKSVKPRDFTRCRAAAAPAIHLRRRPLDWRRAPPRDERGQSKPRSKARDRFRRPACSHRRD